MSALQSELGTAAEEKLALRQAHNTALFKLELLVDMWALRALDVQADAF